MEVIDDSAKGDRNWFRETVKGLREAGRLPLLLKQSKRR